jgi:2-methylisocitrate lyase-like PEP mutase family enzyme
VRVFRAGHLERRRGLCARRSGWRIDRSTRHDRGIARIARAVAIPVYADLECGYGHAPAEVAETGRLAVEAGVVGVNLEDARQGATSLNDLNVQCAIIRAARHAADASGIPLLINARTDAF